MRETLPFSMKQMSQVRAFSDMREVDGWIQDFVKAHEAQGESYYLHIDHLTILPHSKGTGYQAVAIYHRVYLKKGE